MSETTIDLAEKRDPGNPFVASCRSFLKKNGFLSDKQVQALRQVSKTRKRRDRFRGLDHDETFEDWSGFSGGLNGDY
tara:strand:+ start:1472 stop:1702 length:231 start_codon:yes stop_codon:yes gene_type:complete